MKKEYLNEGSFYCDKCNCVGDANGGTLQDGNVALPGRTGNNEIDVAFGDNEVLCEGCLNNYKEKHETIN